MNLKESIRRVLREDRYKGYKRFLKDNVFTDLPEYIINDMFRESGDLDYSQVQGMTKDQIIDYFFNGDGKLVQIFKGVASMTYFFPSESSCSEFVTGVIVLVVNPSGASTVYPMIKKHAETPLFKWNHGAVNLCSILANLKIRYKDSFQNAR